MLFLSVTGLFVDASVIVVAVVVEAVVDVVVVAAVVVALESKWERGERLLS